MATFILHSMKPVVHRDTIYTSWVVYGLALFLLYVFLSQTSGFGDMSADWGILKRLFIHASAMGDILFSVGFFVFLFRFFRERVDLPSFAYAVLFTQLMVQLIKNGTDAGEWMLFQERLHPGFQQSPFISSYAAHIGVLFGWLFFQRHSRWSRAVFLILFLGSLLSRYILIRSEPVSLCFGGFVGILNVSLTIYVRHRQSLKQASFHRLDQSYQPTNLGNVLSV
ncbi:MAG: hypothetical protein ACKO5C_03390 [Ferruginibacter sp.]